MPFVHEFETSTSNGHSHSIKSIRNLQQIKIWKAKHTSKENNQYNNCDFWMNEISEGDFLLVLLIYQDSIIPIKCDRPVQYTLGPCKPLYIYVLIHKSNLLKIKDNANYSDNFPRKWKKYFNAQGAVCMYVYNIYIVYACVCDGKSKSSILLLF